MNKLYEFTGYLDEWGRPEPFDGPLKKGDLGYILDPDSDYFCSFRKKGSPTGFTVRKTEVRLVELNYNMEDFL